MTRRPPEPADASQKIGAPSPSDQQSGAEMLAACGDFDMRIARDGTWFYRDTPIRRKPLVKLFSTVIQRDEAGDYWLVLPAERGRIRVEDAPFTAVEFEVAGTGRGQVLRLRNNVDDWIEAGPEHPIRVAEDPATGEPSPYVLVRENLEALILRSVFYQLVDRAVEQQTEDGVCLGLWSKHCFFPLGRLP